MTLAEFEAELINDGFDVLFGGLRANELREVHNHAQDARIFIIGGEITISRNGRSEKFSVGGHWSLAPGEGHAEQAGPRGVAYMLGYRRT